MRAVIDRFEGDTAVILLGREETVLHVASSDLPRGGQEGSILMLRWHLLSSETDAVREGMLQRIQRLWMGPSDGLEQQA